MNTKCCRFRASFLPLSAVLLCSTVLLASIPNGADADPPPAPIQFAPRPAAPHPISLAEALTLMPDTSVTDGSIVLTVEPSRVALIPQPMAATQPDMPASDAPAIPEEIVPTPYTIAAHYGRSLQVFSHVIALAPPTMTVLNTDPTLADLPISELAAQHPMPFLLGTLTPTQIQQMSALGLGFADLSPEQQALLKDALPSPFQIIPHSLRQPTYTEDEINKIGDERAEIDARIKEETRVYNLNTQTIPETELLSSLRLYGFLAPGFTFDGSGNSIGEDYSENGIETTGAYRLVNGGRTDIGLPTDNKLNAVLRSEFPNVPKASDLDWDKRALAKSISLQGVRTIDDLTTRLAKVTGLELYADSHYANQFVQVRGNLKTNQPAGDVMQALAVCVCGTWRQVGPGYVLTDDVAGLGTRQVFLKEMVQAWSNHLTEAGKAVGGHLAELDWLHKLRFAPEDIGMLSPAQVDAIHKENGTNGGHLRWSELPAPLRAGLHQQLTRHFDGGNMGSFEATAKGIAKSLTPDFKVGVDLNIRIGVALPNTGAMTLGDIYRVQMPIPTPPPSAPVSTPSPGQINSITLDKPLRGVLCAPKTPDEARSVVAALPKMGMNTLFLAVFTNGRTYFPNHFLTPANPQASGVLQAALEAASVKHLAVYAVVDLLCWRKDGAAVHPLPWPKLYSEDLTIRGEAPDRSVQRQYSMGTIRSDFDREYEMVEKGNQGWASPLDSRVSGMLPGLVQTLAATPGLAGLVFQDTTPPGYLGISYDRDEEGISLGYTPENRLAYLRTHHSDPIDLSNFDNIQLFLPFEGYQTSFDVSLPVLRQFGSDTSGVWNKLRGDADKSLLVSCYAAARSAAPTLPLLMRERQMGMTFDPWTDPMKLNQIASLNTLDHPFQQISPTSILRFTYGPVEKSHPERFVWETQGYGMVGDDGKRAGGEVFDLVTGGAPENLLDTLDKLNVFLKKP